MPMHLSTHMSTDPAERFAHGYTPVYPHTSTHMPAHTSARRYLHLHDLTTKDHVNMRGVHGPENLGGKDIIIDSRADPRGTNHRAHDMLDNYRSTLQY